MCAVRAGKYRDLYYITEKGALMPPNSVVFGMDIGVADFLRNIIEYYFGDIESIYDPTCGPMNYQFSKYLEKRDDGYVYAGRIRYIASDIIETKWNCVNGRCLKVDVLKPPYPFPPNSVDIIVYDPPFLTRSRRDVRGEYYDISVARDIEEVKQYYSEEIIREFHRIARAGIILKGADFYHPYNTDNLVLFIPDILDISTIRKYFRITALHIYRYFTSSPLLRARRGKATVKRGTRVEFHVHSYYVVLRKK